MNSQFLAGFVAAVFALIGVYAYAQWGSSLLPEAQVPAPLTIFEPRQAILTGTISCLPHKGDGPYTLECAFGLQTAEGKYYALRDLSAMDETLTETNVRIEASGILTPPEAQEKYNIEGVLKVESVRRL